MMKTILRTAAATAAAALLAGAAHAQGAPRVYENGSVWQVSYIETKPGKFDDYLAYLNTAWRASNEAGMKTGDILSYKIMAVNSTRDNEPNLILMIEYKNMAVFDASQAEQDKRMAQIWGTQEKEAQSLVARENMRIQRGSVLTRELKLAK